MTELQKRIQNLEKQLAEANAELKRIENTIFTPRRQPELTELGKRMLNHKLAEQDPTTLFGQNAIMEILRDTLTPMGIKIKEYNFKQSMAWMYLYVQCEFHDEYFMERACWDLRAYQ